VKDMLFDTPSNTLSLMYCGSRACSLIHAQWQCLILSDTNKSYMVFMLYVYRTKGSFLHNTAYICIYMYLVFL